MEKKCHKYFAEYKLSNELYDKQYYNKYVNFLKKNKEDYDSELENMDNNDEEFENNDEYENNGSDNEDEDEDEYEDEDEDESDNEENKKKNNKNSNYNKHIIKPIKILSSFEYHKNNASDIFSEIKIISDSIDLYLCVSDIETIIGENNNYNLNNLVYVNINDNNELYIKYMGLLEVIFTTNCTNKTIIKLKKWICDIICSFHVGNNKQKNKLIADIKNVGSCDIKEIFNKYSSTNPCIYLYTIGTVKNLRKNLKINKKYDDDSIIYKYGLSRDITNTTDTLTKLFNNLSGSDFRLTIFNFIDVQYMSQAETDLKLYMKDTDLKFNHSKYIELAIVPKSMLKSVKKQYDLIGKSYIGHIKELTDKIKDKDNEIKLIKKDCDIMKINHENELLKKDLEMMKMENKLLNKKLK
nr:hypothetical protein [Megavirus caiporensis]